MIPLYCLSYSRQSGPNPTKPGSLSSLPFLNALPFTELTGRNVILPALFSLSDLIAAFALLSSSQTTFCSAAPSAVSIAVSYPAGTFIRSATTPLMPRSPDFITCFTA